ncbi:hypothetical protein LSH36_806g02034 [Paralvinella palmiformis]|uniref:Uncharacterized protein n=1 Tax=Paralvinella palmiformis TaxID=53620 RepID=A0AAD9J081_9ANNE|nr:hypothetical protein LSH36_806g02034 [Paralvinella palmiformis]
MLRDLKTSCHRPWIFVNGYNPEELSPCDVYQWKKKRSKGRYEAAEDWHKGLLQKRLVKTKKESIERSVIGLPWKHVYGTINNILASFDKRRLPGGQHIRIIHNTLSKQNLKILIQEDAEDAGDFKSPVYNVGSEFIDSEIFNVTYKDNSVKQLLKVVCGVVKRRARSLENGK